MMKNQSSVRQSLVSPTLNERSARGSMITNSSASKTQASSQQHPATLKNDEVILSVICLDYYGIDEPAIEGCELIEIG